MININPQIKSLWLKDIKPWKENPREITNDALEGLRNSLERFGYVNLLVVNKRTNELIAGHQRFKVLQEQGVKRIACILIDMDQFEHTALSLSLNNEAIMGYWTSEVIEVLETLRNQMPEDYLDLRLDQLREEVNELEIEKTGKTLPDDIPEPPKKAITRPGDLWILGDHRLLCGDSTKEENVEKLFDGKKATLFATDPPYMVDYTGADRPTGGKDWSNVYHEIDIPDARKFVVDFYTVGLKFIEKDTALYLWHASKRRRMIEDILEQLGILIHQQIIWVKPCAILTFSMYSWRHEPCLLAWQKGNKPFYRPSKKAISSVWPLDYLKSGDPTTPEYYTDIWELDWEGKKRNPGLEHPTVKPTEVFAIPMRVHTKPGDICYEPFCGSGSQIIAAECLNRRCFAIEMEPIFCDVAVKRWEEFTGMKAKRIKSKAT